MGRGCLQVDGAHDGAARIDREGALLQPLLYLLVLGTGLTAQSTFPVDIMADQLHLKSKGYEIWFEKMQPLLDEMMR